MRQQPYARRHSPLGLPSNSFRLLPDSLYGDLVSMQLGCIFCCPITESQPPTGLLIRPPWVVREPPMAEVGAVTVRQAACRVTHPGHTVDLRRYEATPTKKATTGICNYEYLANPIRRTTSSEIRHQGD